MSSSGESPVILFRYRENLPPRSAPDWVAEEEPLEIRIRGRGIVVTMRTPGHDNELAAGFLFSEGVLREAADLVEIAHCQNGENARLANILNVFVNPSVEVDFDHLSRFTFAGASCGLCGKATIESIHHSFPPLENDPTIDPVVISSLPEKLLQAQDTFAKTGGLHAAALFDLAGNLLVLREDIGRHNAVDKAIGWAFVNGRIPLSRHLLLVSGRASFEIMQKALAARIPIVAAVSAPSSLAVQFAEESRQTLLGFLRGHSFNAYTHPHRLKSEGASTRSGRAG